MEMKNISTYKVSVEVDRRVEYDRYAGWGEPSREVFSKY